MENKNPFQYGKIAEKENFIDRDQDRFMLKSLLYSGNNVILMSPRRWGKSSLVKQAMSELVKENKNVRVCYIDAFPVKSSSEFYRVFSQEVIKAAVPKMSALMSMVRRFLGHFSPKISFGADPASEFTLSIALSDNVSDENEILNLPERIAKDKKIQIIVCIDEFQKLAKLPDYETLEARMRSVWQHQQHVSYCLYGSQRHMMQEIFNSTEKPFYRFGQVYPIKKIARSHWLKYIDERFTSTGKKISKDLAKKITEIAECHSWYVQQLSSGVWNFTEKKADEEALRKGLIWCVDVNSEAYAQICDKLSEAQINLLRAVAAKETQLTSDNALRTYAMGTSAAVVKNKKSLLESDIITTVPGKKELAFLDPIFKIWFKETMCRQ